MFHAGGYGGGYSSGFPNGGVSPYGYGMPQASRGFDSEVPATSDLDRIVTQNKHNRDVSRIENW
jgi:hypothetical protein